tara:strand:- start:271 stop:702 length:432 start_codon:yes stop_codon:yes gene_type:complete
MAKHDDKIAETLDLEPIEPVKGEVVKVEPAKDQKLETDFQYARENLYNIIERGTDALNGIVDLANQSQHPRSFEVVADLVRTLSGANKDLLDIQKKMKDMDPESHGPKKVENNLFIGSTKDLTDLLDGGARKVPKIKKKNVDN